MPKNEIMRNSPKSIPASLDFLSDLKPVTFNNSLVNLAIKDTDTIAKMRAIIDKQATQLKKKHQLFLAINHNLDYLKTLYKENTKENELIKQRNVQLFSENQELREENDLLKQQLDKFKRDSEMLMREQQRIA